MTELPSPTVWALTDDRPGNTAQVRGVTDALAWPVEEKAIGYTVLASLPNVIRGVSLIGVTSDSRAALSPPWPDVLVAAGRRAAPVARWIKRQSGGKTRLAQIMFPGWIGAQEFDVIVVPDHDANGRAKTRSNVISMTGAPTRITLELLAKETVKWKDRFASLPRPFIAVIVGGATKQKPFPRARALDLGLKVAALAKDTGGSILLTTSRHTGQMAEQALLEAIPEPRFVHAWQPEGENPYLGFLALADAIVVTGDSVTMCAEACATEAPVYIYAPPGTVSAKHARLHQQLYDLGYAKPLGEALEPWSHTPHNPAAEIADAIRQAVEQKSY